ncbi:MAG: DUF1385 domain-containing protein [Bacillota bacterium]
MPDKVIYGGQAVIEGVMMRGPNKVAVAIRLPDGRITTRLQHAVSWVQKHAALGLAFIRGPVSLVEMVVLGIDALLYSAQEGLGEEQLSRTQTILTVAGALVFSVLAFIVGPTFVVDFLRRALDTSSVVLNILEGVVRIFILVAYIAAISLSPEVKRVLEYHGAEHKVINAYEHGATLDPVSVSGYPRFHPRCGTSFLFMVAFISVLLFSTFGWPGIFQRVLLRLGLLPVVAALSYEIIRLAGRRAGTFAKVVTLPGVWIQRLTTREPDISQIEVALEAFKNVAGGFEHAG